MALFRKGVTIGGWDIVPILVLGAGRRGKKGGGLEKKDYVDSQDEIDFMAILN